MNYEPEIFRASLRDGTSIKSLPQNSTTNKRNRIVNKFYESIGKDARRIFAGGQDPMRYCERIMEGGYQVVKNSKGKSDFVFAEKIYAVEGENGYEGIVERVFTKRERYKSIPEKLNDETLARINEETGYNLNRFDLLLLAGYVFIKTNSDKTESITCCVPAVDYIEKDYLYNYRMSENKVIKNYKFTDHDGKELDEEEIMKLVGKVMTEIEPEKTTDISQGETR